MPKGLTYSLLSTCDDDHSLTPARALEGCRERWPVSGPMHSVSEGSMSHGLCHSPRDRDEFMTWGLGNEPWEARECGILVLVLLPEPLAGGPFLNAQVPIWRTKY